MLLSREENEILNEFFVLETRHHIKWNRNQIDVSHYVLIDTGLYVYNKIHLVQQWNKNEPKSPVQQPFGRTIFHLSDNGGSCEHGWWNIISNAKCNRLIKSIRDYVTLYVCVQYTVQCALCSAPIGCRAILNSKRAIFN